MRNTIILFGIISLVLVIWFPFTVCDNGNGGSNPFVGTWTGMDSYGSFYRLTMTEMSEFFKYPPEIRRAIYTTNAVESLNYQLRKVIKNRLLFSTDDAIFKILYLAIRNASEKWTMLIREWGRALNQFVIEFGNERVPFK